MASKKQKGGNSKKIGRSNRRAKGRTTPFSRYVRGLITAEQYFAQTGQKKKRGS